MSKKAALQIVADVASDAQVALGSAGIANRAAEAAADAQIAAEHAAMTAARMSKGPPADPRDSPHFELLRGDSEGVFSRMSPRRNRWPELEQIDARVNEIDGKQTDAAAELQQARDKRQGADVRHQIALANWFEQGEPDPRPASEAGQLDDRIAALEAEHAALDITRARVFEERVAYVVKRRKALVDDAAKATQERLARCLELVNELEQARQELIELRHTTIWASLYPSPALASDVPFTNLIVGARLSLQERHLPGVKNHLPAHSLFELFRDDANHCATALTLDQAAEIQGTTTKAISGKEAAWDDRASAHATERREKELARQRFRNEWGYDPPEFK